MKYFPDYHYVNQLFVEDMVIDEASASITLLARFPENGGISSVKHIFCDTSDLAKLLGQDTLEADLVLGHIVHLIELDKLGEPEEIDVEELLGHPLTLSKYILRMYHPLVENRTGGPMILDNGLYELDSILPKPTSQVLK